MVLLDHYCRHVVDVLPRLWVSGLGSDGLLHGVFLKRLNLVESDGKGLALEMLGIVVFFVSLHVGVEHHVHSVVKVV